MTFYNQSLLAVKEGRKLLEALHVPAKRPNDYFCENVKTDTHMNRVSFSFVLTRARHMQHACLHENNLVLCTMEITEMIRMKIDAKCCRSDLVILSFVFACLHFSTDHTFLLPVHVVVYLSICVPLTLWKNRKIRGYQIKSLPQPVPCLSILPMHFIIH